MSFQLVYARVSDNRAAMYSVPTVDTDHEGCNAASEEVAPAFDGVSMATLGLPAVPVTGETDAFERGPVRQVVTIQEEKYLVDGKNIPSVPDHERCTACTRRRQECSGWDGVPCAACLSSGGRKCSKSQITGSTGATTYNVDRPVYAEPPCDHCLKKGFDCTGLPLGRCDSCRDLRHRCSRSIIQTRRRQKDSTTFSIVPYLKSQISLLPEDVRYRITYNIRGVDISVDILPASLRPQTSDSGSGSESDLSVVPLGWVEFQSTDVCPVVELGRPGDVWIRLSSEKSTQPSSEVVYVCGELDGNGAAQWSLVSSEQLHESTTNDPLIHPLVRGCAFGRSETLTYCWKEISDELKPIIGNKRALDIIGDTADTTIAVSPGAKRSRHSQDPHRRHVHFSPFVIVRHDFPSSPLPSRIKDFVTPTKPKKRSPRSPRRPRGQVISFDGGDAGSVAPRASSQAQTINTQATESIEGDTSLEVGPHGVISADAPACIYSPEIRLSGPDSIIPASEPNPSEVSCNTSSENPASVVLSTGGDLHPSESSLPARLPASDPAASLTSPNDHPNSETITPTPTCAPSTTDSNARAPAEDGPQTIMASMEGGVTTLWKVLSQVHGADFDAVMVDTCEGLVLVLQQLQGQYRAAIADKNRKGS